MKNKSLIILPALLLVLLVTPCLAASFTANLITSQQGKAQKGKFYYMDQRYRMEVTEDNEPLVILVDRKSGKTRILVPSEKAYVETRNTAMKSLIKNPFEAYEYMKSKYDVRSSGTQRLGNFVCEKEVILVQGKQVMTVWIAEKFKFPIKLINTANGLTAELKNIKETSLKSQIFSAPNDFHQVEHLPIAPPKWAKDISKAPILKVPFSQDFSAGQIIRIKPVAGYFIKLKVTNLQDKPCRFTAVAFKNGRPLKDPSFHTFNASRKREAFTTRHKAQPAQADDIVVRVAKGKVRISSSLQKAPTDSQTNGRAQHPAKVRSSSMSNTVTAVPNVIIILDASGSMWGQINGKPKIQIAKRVMDSLIDRLPKNMKLGLMAYGHRRKGDCNDIQMLSPIAKPQAAQLKAKINAINPKGKTPLTAAVKLAAQRLRYAEQAATVILVSDGLETCGGNPCEVAEALAMNGVDFTVHVIGFDLSKQEQQRLRCLADKTGGLFLAASNAASLHEALFKTIKRAQAPPPPVKENPGRATLHGPRSVPAGAAFEVTWDGPNSRRDFVSLAKKGSKDLTYLSYAYTQSANPVRLKAPADPGQYELRYVHAHSHQVIGRAGIKVTPVTAKIAAPPSAPVAGEFQVKWDGPGYGDDYISIAKPGQAPGSYMEYSYLELNPVKLRAPSEPGTYEVRYIMGCGTKLLARTPIAIKGVTAHVEAPESAPASSKIKVTWSGPAHDDDYISIARPDQGPGEYLQYNYVSEGNPLPVQVPSSPGTYEVRYIMGKGIKLLAKATITIKKVGAQVKAPPVAFASSHIKVLWQGPGYDDDYVCISRPDDAPGGYAEYQYLSEGNPVKVRAPSNPGHYEVRYIMGKGNKILAKSKITIKDPKVKLKVPDSAPAKGYISVQWQGPGYSEDYICVSRPDQAVGDYLEYQYVSEGSPIKVKAPSKSGTYEVRYIMGHGNKVLAKEDIAIK